MKSFFIIPFLSALLLAACAHKEPKPPKTQENFSTLIKPDGTKQFSFLMTMEMPERKDGGGKMHGGPGDHSGHGGPGGHHDGPPGDHKGRKDDGEDDHFDFMFSEALNSQLTTTGFCRSGFKQLDTQSRRGAKLVKAACNDDATDADRQKFPNPPLKKVKVDVLE